ncbi:TIGR03576 family pyridoxal phosphate-dependent enzyme [Methanococcus voltae]|uniref:L-seryl-tRNA(Ser) seleniumtransferase n=2 Tax=Methanococcus voltae TaxID=2188 RepID=A0A8J7UT10_METVO|nr:TIGR03576 family pyridoxal phosphate-dependent enzyme [Methanococcus voltae]MBP2173258.1 L-seryl-tRNA(Ser) seleniumtransferase [Methanococcus voltae]MBP2202122.1 L-seryl-tRNA(Ser) seleniumtransferase [Methanococcus voltae]MCS3922935.1 L-seryl-tRNA(Ser) seleniumtransferase [Methanococcus voltae PS]
MKDLEFERIVKTREILRNNLKKHGRDNIYDLTGLTGGFYIEDKNLDFLETYTGPAIFTEKLNRHGLLYLHDDFTEDSDIKNKLESLEEYCKYEKAVGFNRTSSALLATIIMLKSKNITQILHYVPEKPSHPSIPKSCNILDIPYYESDNFDEIISLIDINKFLIITGSTMNHKIVDFENAKKLIEYCHSKDIKVLFDDASGARIRLLNGQQTALNMGADLVVTSMDKLMNGPRAGLLAGNKELINEIYSEGLKYGLEAQAPILAAMVYTLKNFSFERIKKAQQRAINFNFDELNEYDFLSFEKTPTGFMINMDSKESYEVALDLLNNYRIITITTLGMPDASKTLRFDFTSKDADRVSDNYIKNSILNALISLINKKNSE